MEERSLRKKLIRLYIVSIALVLSLVFAITALFTLRDERQTGRESFLTLFTLIAERLQTDSTIQHSLLRKYEQQNQIHYFITDAGSSLQYNSDDGDMAVALSNRVKAGAAQMGVDINAIPLTAQRVTSPVLEFRHDGVSYYGAASVIPLRNSFRAENHPPQRLALRFLRRGVSIERFRAGLFGDTAYRQGATPRHRKPRAADGVHRGGIP